MDHPERTLTPKVICRFGENRRLNENNWGVFGVANMATKMILCIQNIGDHVFSLLDLKN